jgi:AcrR family transcriptional regulator
MNDKRSDILEATLTLISAHGFHGTPMSQIATEAGVGAGTIYRYFENKEALINELFLEIKREFSQSMMANINLEDTTETIFRQIWLNTFNYCIEYPKKMVFLEQFHNSPFQTPETEAATFAFVAPLVEIFQSAIETGEIKKIPFEMLTAFAYDITVAFAKHHITGKLVMDKPHLEMAVQACWDAIKAN